MLQEMSKAEQAELENRVKHLFGSKWIVDNLTAVLMDTSIGFGHGFHENIAREKAHRVIDWLESVGGVKVPAVRP